MAFGGVGGHARAARSPACADELFLGARETGVTLNGTLITVSERASLEGATVLSNRAYSLALIAAGRADALWSRSSKHEWDTAAGTALIAAAGGRVTTYEGGPIRFNAWPPRSPGIVATNGAIHRSVQRFIARLPKPRR